MSEPAASAEPAPKSSARQWIWRIVRIAVTVLALAWVLSRVDLGALGAAFLRVSWMAFALVIAITLFNMGVGTLRWRVLLAAYGAPRLPSLAELVAHLGGAPWGVELALTPDRFCAREPETMAHDATDVLMVRGPLDVTPPFALSSMVRC